MKKVIVLAGQLPILNEEETSFFFRYRIVSQDKNRRSHWSPIHQVVDTFTGERPNIEGGEEDF
jgi:hypothetical protein